MAWRLKALNEHYASGSIPGSADRQSLSDEAVEYCKRGRREHVYVVPVCTKHKYAVYVLEQFTDR